MRAGDNISLMALKRPRHWNTQNCLQNGPIEESFPVSWRTQGCRTIPHISARSG